MAITLSGRLVGLCGDCAKITVTSKLPNGPEDGCNMITLAVLTGAKAHNGIGFNKFIEMPMRGIQWSALRIANKAISG